MSFVFSTYSYKNVLSLVYGIVALNCFPGFGTHAQPIPQAEGNIIHQLSLKFGSKLISFFPPELLA